MSTVAEPPPPLVILRPSPRPGLLADLFRQALHADLGPRRDEEVRRLIAHPAAPEEFLLELCARGEYLDELGHRTVPLSLVQRMASRHRYPEAVLTLGKIYYTDPETGAEQLRKFLTEHADLPWLFESLARESANPVQKEQVLLQVVDPLPDRARVRTILDEQALERRAATSTDPEEIERLFQLGMPLVWRSVASNPHSPIPILQRLLAAEGVKYSRDIRARARENLFRRGPPGVAPAVSPAE
jgi:hypothetical protein